MSEFDLIEWRRFTRAQNVQSFLFRASLEDWDESATLQNQVAFPEPDKDEYFQLFPCFSRFNDVWSV